MQSHALPDPDHQAAFFAGVAGKRALAFIVDVIITALICAAIIPFTGFIALFFLPGLFLFVNFFYRWITISNRSATPGMRLAAIEFRRADGTPFDAGTALVHTLAFLISLSLGLPQLVSMAVMVFGGRGQGLTDLFLGSVVINRPSNF